MILSEKNYIRSAAYHDRGSELAWNLFRHRLRVTVRWGGLRSYASPRTRRGLCGATGPSDPNVLRSAPTKRRARCHPKRTDGGEMKEGDVRAGTTPRPPFCKIKKSSLSYSKLHRGKRTHLRDPGERRRGMLPGRC